MELELLAPVIRSCGHQVSLVYDPDAFGITDNVLQIPALNRLLSAPEEIVRSIVRSQPDVVFFSVLPGTYAWTQRIAPRVKQRLPDVPIVMIGLHPSLVPDRVMRDDFVDYIIQGEVENSIHPLLDVVAGNEQPENVGSLWYRRAGDIRQNPRAELVDLDALPLPDKDLFRPHVSHSFSYAAMVSRGCPYRCSFCEETCSKKLYGGQYYRRKSVDTVMAELVAGKKKFHYREVIFKDSYLSGNKTWLADLMERYKREIDVPFKCFCTVHGFDDETAKLLKRGGCYSIEFGLQTWNPDIRHNILNRQETNEQAMQAFHHCARHRLWYDVDHMFNLPYESESDHVESARQYSKLRYLNRVKVHFLQYLPTADIVEHGMAADNLPSDAREKLADGLESDFYDMSTGNGEDKAKVTGFAALYKLLPVLPKSVTEWLLQDGRVRNLRYIPSPLMSVLQGLIAMRSGDLRFFAYLSMYPNKVSQAILSRRSA